MSKTAKSIAQWIFSLFVGAFLLMWTLSWVSGQPRLPYSTVLLADFVSALIVMGAVLASAVVFKIFED